MIQKVTFSLSLRTIFFFFFLWVLFYIINILSLKESIYKGLYFSIIFAYAVRLSLQCEEDRHGLSFLMHLWLCFSVYMSLDLNTHFNQCK